MPTYAVTLTFDQDDDYRLQVRPAHRDYLTALTAAGTLRLAGPYADGAGALLVYDVADRAALDAVLAADPYFSGDQPAASVAQVQEWGVLDLGGVAPAQPVELDPAAELDDLLESLDRHRGFLRQTLTGLSDAQAGEQPTVSELCLGGLIKHVAATEKSWIEFAVHGDQPSDDAIDWGSIDWSDPSTEALAAVAAREAEFRMLPEDSIERVLAGYAQVAAETERTLRGLDLDASHPLPAAPWFEPGAAWTVRRTVIHVIAETAQHAGHADIIREAIDGAKTMG